MGVQKLQKMVLDLLFFFLTSNLFICTYWNLFELMFPEIYFQRCNEGQMFASTCSLIGEIYKQSRFG